MIDASTDGLERKLSCQAFTAQNKRGSRGIPLPGSKLLKGTALIFLAVGADVSAESK